MPRPALRRGWNESTRVSVSSRRTGDHVLTMRGIDKRFGAVRALNGVDFRVREGEVVALVGDNGAGKSTLVKVLAGVHPADAGTIELDGDVVQLSTPADAQDLGIATVFQEPLHTAFEPAELVQHVGFQGLHREQGNQSDHASQAHGLVAAVWHVEHVVKESVAFVPHAFAVLAEVDNQPLTTVARSTYVAMNGSQEVNYRSGTNDGAFLRNSQFHVGHIGDGLTNTIFVGERNSRLSLSTWTGAVTGAVVPYRPSPDPLDWNLAPALVLGHTGGNKDPDAEPPQFPGIDADV